MLSFLILTLTIAFIGMVLTFFILYYIYKDEKDRLVTALGITILASGLIWLLIGAAGSTIIESNNWEKKVDSIISSKVIESNNAPYDASALNGKVIIWDLINNEKIELYDTSLEAFIDDKEVFFLFLTQSNTHFAGFYKDILGNRYSVYGEDLTIKIIKWPSMEYRGSLQFRSNPPKNFSVGSGQKSPITYDAKYLVIDWVKANVK